MSMSDEKIQEIMELMESFIKSRLEQDLIHEEEHRYLRSLIKKNEESSELRRAILKKVVEGGVWAVIVALGGSVLLSIKHFFKG